MKTKKIPTSLSNYLEQLHYENISYKNLIKFLLLEKIPFENESFQKIYEDYKKSEISYNIAKNNLKRKYNIKNNEKWELDFYSEILTIKE